MLNLPKDEVVRIIRIRYINVENQEYLNKLLKNVLRMPETQWQEELKRRNIENIEDVYFYVENFLNNLASTKVNYQIGTYLQRIHSDEKLMSILNQAKQIKNPTPEKLSYFVSFKLAELLSEDAYRAFDTKSNQVNTYNKPVNEEYAGICKSMAELYADMMSELGVHVELVRQQLDYPEYAHIDAIVVLEDKAFVVNEIANVYRVQTNRLIKDFGTAKYPDYQKRIEAIYGQLTVFSSDEVKAFNEELGLVRKRDINGNAIYFDEQLDEFILSKKAERDNQSPKERAQNLPIILQEYINFVLLHESFCGNNRIKEKEAHYANCFAKFIRALGLFPNAEMALERELCVSSNNNLLQLWIIFNHPNNTIQYFMIDDNHSLTEIDGEKTFEYFNSGRIMFVGNDRAMPEDVQDQKIKDYFGQYILTVDRISRETGEEQYDFKLKDKIKNFLDELIRKSVDFIK